MNAVEQGVITAKQLKELEPQPASIHTKPEETDEYIRIPNPKDSGSHDGHRIRTLQIDTDKGITALYCGECKKVKTYIFAKAKGWTMAKAKKWVQENAKIVMVVESAMDSKNHGDYNDSDMTGVEGTSYLQAGGSTAIGDLTTSSANEDYTVVVIGDNDPLDTQRLTEEADKASLQPVTQEELRDEIDYLREVIEDAGMEGETKEVALELVETIKRLTGADIPDNIDDGDEDKGLSREDAVQIIKASVKEAIEKAQGKVE